MVNHARLASRIACTGLALALALAGASSGCSEPAQLPASHSAGPARALPTDLAGQALELLGADDRADALIFVRTDCPISNRYAPKLASLAERFAEAPLDLWLVYVDPDEDAEAIREHVAAYSLPGRPIRDPSQVLATRAKARVTPEAAVFDAKGVLRYHGRIDDWYVDYGKSRTEASTAELADALDAVLAGVDPSIAETEAVGCPLPPLPDR